MDPQKIAALRSELDTKLEAVQAETDPEKAGSLLAEAKSLRSQIEQLQGNEAEFAALRSWAQEPVNRLQQPAGNLAPGSVLQTRHAGAATIEQEQGKSVLYQDGEGLLTEAQLKTVRSDDYLHAFRSYLRRGGDLGRLGRDEIRSLVEGQDEQGGFLAPEEFITRLIERRPTPTNVADLVTNLNTSRDRVVLPRATYSADDLYSSGVRISWVGENGPAAAATTPAFGSFAVNIFTSLIEVQLTNDMIEDSVFPVSSYASGKVREAWDVERDRCILRGSGIQQPTGILTKIDTANGVASYNSGSAASITADKLIGITYQIPEQYLNAQRWIFNRRSTEATIAGLKDGQNRYLFSAGTVDASLATARPEGLLGFPLTRSALMPDLGAGAFPILHGDPTAYYWIQRAAITIQILNEVEARNNAKVMLARVRAGGDTAEAWRMRAMKCST